MSRPAITIIGAGLVGSLMSIYLARRGYHIQVFEKRPDMRLGNLEGGRSINLALSHRGLKALDKVDLLPRIMELCLPMKGRMMHDHEGALTFQQYGTKTQRINSISRSQLNILLMDTAEAEGVQIHFNEKCIGADIDSGVVRFKGPRGKHQVKADWILGTDGAFSGLRKILRKTDRFNYSQYYLPHGYKELTIPPTSSGGFALDPEALHIWPREQYMLIALPNLDRSFTCTLFLPFNGESSFDQLKHSHDVEHFFKTSFNDVLPLMPDLLNDFFDHPTSSMVTIRCDPWFRSKACLLGDASHAIVPFYGQGMNAGFEDCRLLDNALTYHSDLWETAYNEFQQQRIPNTNAIADLAFQNFIEMRDLVADEEFLLRKKIEQRLHELYPQQWIPLYSMVSFSDIPYGEAQRIGSIQQSIMDKVLTTPNLENNWESLDFRKMVTDLRAQVDSQ